MLTLDHSDAFIQLFKNTSVKTSVYVLLCISLHKQPIITTELNQTHNTANVILIIDD